MHPLHGIKEKPGVNTICKTCDDSLDRESALRFLCNAILKLYNFYIAICRKTLSSQFYITPGSSTHKQHEL
jgi:hypothetical protein